MKNILSKILKLKLNIIFPLAFSAWILIFSIVRPIQQQIGEYTFDINSGTVAHFTAYFLLSSLWFLYHKRDNIKKVLAISAVTAGLFGMFIEFVQYIIPYRHFEPYDMIINFTGALMVFPAYYIIKKLSE